MKINLHRWLFLAVALWGILPAGAYDFQVDGIYYEINGDEVTVTNETGSTQSNSYSGAVVIPSSVSYNDKTYAVTCIGASAFFRCEDLTSVTLPNTVSVISKWAFAGCTGLTSITIPESVTEIGANAFFNCNALLSITIPESIIIGRSAFNGTAWYNSQPDGVVYINRVLYDCTGKPPATIEFE